MLTLHAFGSSRSLEPLFGLVDDFVSRPDTAYPAHDIEMLGHDRYRVTLAVPGFARDELAVEASDCELTVRGRKRGADRRITADAFEFRVPLGAYMRVTNAHLADGLLTIDLARELPPALKPRVIPIRGGSKLRLAKGESMVAKARRLLTGRKAA
jgi:molecular chaperone IbpA